MRSIIFLSVLLTLLFSACNLEREVELTLPVYESQLVVECYLEPGKPFNLLLTRSSAYFDAFPTDATEFVGELLEDSAQVRIEYGEESFLLDNGLFFDFETGKLYNYQNAAIVPADYDTDFRLFITTRDGRSIEAETRLLPVVPIDSVVVQFDDRDSLARLLTYFTDEPGTSNFYRRTLHEESLDSTAVQDFLTNDGFLESSQAVFGTGFSYERGDVLINTLVHMDRAYYDFWQSVQLAIVSNGNPFGQPGTIASNLRGDADAFGIFTGLSYDRVVTVVE